MMDMGKTDPMMLAKLLQMRQGMGQGAPQGNPFPTPMNGDPFPKPMGQQTGSNANPFPAPANGDPFPAPMQPQQPPMAQGPAPFDQRFGQWGAPMTTAGMPPQQPQMGGWPSPV